MNEYLQQASRYDSDDTIVSYFEKQVESNAEKIAVKSGIIEMTYGTLNKTANRLAHALLEVSEQRGETVALLFEHGMEMIAAILGVLKAGEIYVPLDAAYPEERLSYILEDSGARIIVTDRKNYELGEKLGSDRSVIVMDIIGEKNSENPGKQIKPEQTAYIMYTSGTTGRPKGVVQNHRSIVKMVGSYSQELEIGTTDRIALFISYSHAAGAKDIFSALFNGAAIYPYKIKAEGSIEKLPAWLKEEGITIYHSVPTVYRYLINTLQEEERFPQIRLVILGGEAVRKSDVEAYRKYFGDDCIFVNDFGASEIISVTLNLIDKGTEISGNIVPVGYPIDEVEIVILNEKDEKQGVFGVGELVYKSDYLACGYWNMAEKTKEAFVTDPAGSGKLVYHSGDLGRLLPDGQIEYLGRRDQQVKIRGYRVELGEIETVADKEKGIEKSVAAAFKGEKEETALILYYTTKEGENVDREKVKARLRQKLPEYMIPQYYMQIEELPLTPNGKLDRKALPEPDWDVNTGVEYEAPRNEVEEKLARIWEDILEVERVGIKDDFFELGGHSLKATKLLLRICNMFGINMELSTIFSNHTIVSLANIIHSEYEKEEKLEDILKKIEEAS